MKLKQITLQGFKSFANKTIIDIDDDLVAIVGPNGSGKSNIIDGIRWVLGERLKELRTKESQDVIFNGSESKKPSNFAKVDLVFYNDDNYLDIEFLEVKFSRKLYRDGTNNYYINDNKCRYKDINNLILDKGFSKDSFAIISQGQINKLTSASPEKRREIVEEVAGILKYKTQKKNAVNKLKRIDLNLEKLTYKLETLKVNLDSLEKEKEAAIKFENINEMLQEKEISFLYANITDIKEKILELEFNIDLLVNKQKNFNQDLALNRDELKMLDNNITAEQTKLNELIQLKSRMDIEKSKKKQDMSFIEQQNKVFLNSNDNKEILQFKNDLKNLTMEYDHFNKQKTNITPKQENTAKEIIALELEQKDLMGKKSQLEIKYSELLARTVDEKIPYNVRDIIENSHISGIIGTVKELYSYNANVEIAIEKIIGMRKFEIVTESKYVAEKGIKYLKQNKRNPLTFIPLDQIKSRFVKADIQEIIATNPNIFLGVAQDFLDFEKKYQKVISSFFGNIILCPNLKAAYKGLKLINNQYQLVTLDGEIIYTSGKIRGGFNSNSANIKLKVEVKEIENKIADINEEQENITNKLLELNKNKTLLDMESSMLLKKSSELEEEIKQKELSIKQFEDGLDNKDYILANEIEEELKELKEKETRIDLDFSQTEEKLKSLRTKKENLEDNQENLLASDKEFQMDLNNYKEQKIKAEYEINGYLTTLREEYTMSFEKASKIAIKNINKEQYAKEIKALKQEMKNLGFINFESIEVYDKEKEEYDELNFQHEDLATSAEKIKTILDKLDLFVKDKFLEAYTKLNKEFLFIFNELFEGGEAKLKLTDPNNLLETGVEIVVNPPGKTPKGLDLLSGGEKALTAIALLFAILKVRKIPFSILDEVEAALDDRNIDKYSKFIKVFSKRTQFIVITHRPKTMNVMNKLYGVSMVDKGISTLLSVDLNNALEEE